jgi:hypothetical protein
MRANAAVRSASFRIVFAVAAAMFALAAHAQTLTVYDDALQNGFADYSFGGGTNPNATAFIHTGTKSASILGHNFNALSFAHAPGNVLTALHTADTPVLRFWVNGGTASGQQFHFSLQLNGSFVGSAAALDMYVSGGGVAQNVWRQVTIDLRQAPFNAVDFDRINIQSDEDATHTDASATYFDDFVLGQPAGSVVNPIQVDHDVLVGPVAPIDARITSDRFTWRDSNGLSRSASLAHNDAEVIVTGNSTSHGGALREFKYQLSNGQTRTATVTTYGNAGYGGFGYVTMHTNFGQTVGCNGDDSPLGMGFGGHWQRIFEGRHHAIFRFTQLYPRNCPTSGSIITRYLPVTIDWVFSTGHDNPLWTVTYDIDQIAATGGQPAGPNMYYDDSRAPYGELNIDGEGFTDLNGVAWGDFYKFTTTNAAGTAITWNSPFNWTQQNTVPFVKEWLDAPLTADNPAKHDATIGIVQTQTIQQQDAGGARDLGVGSDITPYWHKTQADGVQSAGPGHALPNGDNWPYQACGDNFYADGVTTNNARMTWKTQYGFIGQNSYRINNGAVESTADTAPGYPKKSYSTYVVLGQHSALPVDAQIAQVETIQSLTLTAATGTVVTTGPAGITRGDFVTYAPAGYNHVYGALAFQASANALDANIQVTPVTTFDVTSPDFYYAFNGISGQNPPISLVQGVTYHFNINTAANHPFEILGAPAGSVTNNNISSGTITFVVPASGGTFRYHCSVHDFGNTITTRGPGAGTLRKPLIIVSNYTGGEPVVKLDSATLVADVDYFASVRASANELWITLNRDLSGATNHLEITGASGALSAPTNLVASATSTSQVTISWSAVAGAANYEIQRSTNINSGFTTLTTVAALTANDSGLTANTTYLYKVRAINGAALSAFSSIDPATTTIFTDDPLNTGAPAKAVHVTQLRTAVNAMRAAANLGAQSFTDPGLASGLVIKALHQNELRTALNQARSAIGLSAIVYTDAPTVTSGTTPIKAAHIVNLRDGVK